MSFEANKAVIDRTLSNFALERGMGAGGPGLALAPLVSVQSLTGRYGIYEGSRNNPDNMDYKRAPGAHVKEGIPEGRDTDTYACVDRARKDKLPVEFSEDFDALSQINQINRLDRVAEKNRHKIVTQHEQDVHDLLWASNEAGFNAIYGADNVNDPSAAWDAGATSRIGKDVANALDRLYTNCGFGRGQAPGQVIALIPRSLFNDLTYESQSDIAERLKFTQTGQTSLQQMANYFDVDQVIVPDNLVDGANRGQDGSWDFMWGGGHAGVFYVDPSESTDKMTLASTFAADQVSAFPFLGVQTWLDDKDTISYYAKTHAWYDAKLVSAACGQIIYDVLT